MSEFDKCHVCGEIPSNGSETVTLNRFIIECREGLGGVSDGFDGDDEAWHESVGSGDAQEDGMVTCWPTCTHMLIDAQFADLRVSVRGSGGGAR